MAEAQRIIDGVVVLDLDDDDDDLDEVECAEYNWVEKVGGLPRYIKRIKKHLVRKGMTESHAIAVAVNVVKKMCATGDINYPGKQNVNAKSRAQACKAVAEWEAKKARAKAKSATLATDSVLHLNDEGVQMADAAGSGQAPAYPPEVQQVMETLRDQYARLESLEMTSQEYRDVSEEALGSFETLQNLLRPLGPEYEEMLTAAEMAADGLTTFLNVDWPEQMSPEDESETLNARTDTYSSFNPDQLRVPKGNGELSGRWVDTPWKALTDLFEEMDTQEDPGFRAPRVKSSLARMKADQKEIARSDIGTPEHSTDVDKALKDLEKFREDVFNYVQIPDGPLAAIDEAEQKLQQYQQILFPPDYDIKNLPTKGEGDQIDNTFPEVTAPATPAPAPAAPSPSPEGGAMARVARGPGRPDGAGTPEDPIDVQGDLARAAQLIAEGKSVRLNSVDEVGTLLNMLADIAQEAKAKGESAPSYDLCKVSVPGTNLFCVQSKGIPRAKMPQLGGTPVPGTRADALPRVRGGEVDITEEFKAELERLGIAAERKQVPAASLKASQNELIGAKVAGIMRAMETAPPDSGLFDPIFVTRDNYVIDGHHRWAAQVGLDAEQGSLGNVMMNVVQIDMEIGEALDFANAFAADFGIAQAGFYARIGKGRVMTLATRGRWTFAFNPKQLRVPRGNGDLSGRWIDTPWQALDTLLSDLGSSKDPGIKSQGTKAALALVQRDAKDMAVADLGSPSYSKAVDNARADLDALAEKVFNYAEEPNGPLAQISAADEALQRYQEILFPADYDVKSLPAEPADGGGEVLPGFPDVATGDPQATGGVPMALPQADQGYPEMTDRAMNLPLDVLSELDHLDGLEGTDPQAMDDIRSALAMGDLQSAIDSAWHYQFDNLAMLLQNVANNPNGGDMAGMWASAANGLNAALVASAMPVKPPKAWFANPNLTEPTALTVTEEGRVYGHLAAWNVCHIGQPEGPNTCTQAPHSAKNYAYFHVGALYTAEGDEIAVGHITLDTGHAGPKLNAMAALAHYDNTGTAVADIRVGEDKYGIWVAGAVRPGLTEKTLRALRAAPLSGDWRRVDGNLELIAALAVNVGGFPIPRPAGLVAAGSVQSLVASGLVPPKKVSRETFEALSTEDLRYLKQLAQREKQRDLKERADNLAAVVRSMATRKTEEAAE